MIGRQELHRLVQLAAAPETEHRDARRRAGHRQDRGSCRSCWTRLPPETTVLVGQAEPGSLGRPFELLLSAVDGRDGVDPAVAGHPDRLVAAPRSSACAPDCRSATAIDHRRPAVVVSSRTLHWADSESIALFERIADLDGPAATRRHLPAGRGDPAQPDRRPARPAGAPARGLPRTAGAARPRRDVGAAHRRRPDARRRTGPPCRCTIRTGGNPFFLEELLRDSRRPTSRSCASEPLPWSLAETLRRQVDHLEPRPPAHGRGGRRCSATGSPFDLLAAVTGDGRGRPHLGAARSWSAEGVLVESGEDEFAFRHALVREAVTRAAARPGAATAARGGAGGSARRRATPTRALVTKHASGRRALRRHARCGPRRQRGLPRHRLGLPGAAAGRDRAGGGLPTTSDLLAHRRPGRLARRPARRRRRRTPAGGRPAQRPPMTAVARAATCGSAWPMTAATPRADGRAQRRADRSQSISLPSRGRPRRARMATLALVDPAARPRRRVGSAWADRTVELRRRTRRRSRASSGYGAPHWSRRARCSSRRSATLERGSVAAARRGRPRPRRPASGCVAALALNKLVHLPPATSVRDVRRPAGTDAGRRQSGPAPRSSPSRAPTTRGEARLFMRKGNLRRRDRRDRAWPRARPRLPAGASLPRTSTACSSRASTLGGERPGWRGGHQPKTWPMYPVWRSAYRGCEFHIASRRGRRGTRTGAAPRRRSRSSSPPAGGTANSCTTWSPRRSWPPLSNDEVAESSSTGLTARRSRTPTGASRRRSWPRRRRDPSGALAHYACRGRLRRSASRRPVAPPTSGAARALDRSAPRR